MRLNEGEPVVSRHLLERVDVAHAPFRVALA
jgi:hypothetical protein